MEWKKDSISASELERKQQEYIREAMEMLKRAKPFAENKPDKEEEKAIEADISETTEENDKSAEEISESADETAESIDDISEAAEEAAESVDDISGMAEEATESVENTSERLEEATESFENTSERLEENAESAEEAAEIAEEIPEAITESSQSEDTVPKKETEETGGKYGVYSAEELINSAGEEEGLKSAAEMLAELKSKTEIMRSLAEAADPKPEKQDLPKGQYVCPKCGRSSPHGRYQ